MSIRQPGRIRRISYSKEDHGILTCYVHLEFEGSGQGFGGIALDPDTTGPDFKRALCDLFDTQDFDSLEGRECFALRHWDHFGERISGLEAPSGKRFMLYHWRKKHYPDTTTPLQDARDAIKREVAFLTRRLSEEHNKLDRLVDGYISWGCE